MKKNISLVLAFFLVLSCFCTLAYAADNAVKISFDKSSVKSGDTVVLSFTMPETDAMKDITSLGIKLSYDPSAFKYVSFSSGWMADAKDGVITANWMSSNAIQGDDIGGRTFAVTFRCIADAADTCGFEVAFDADNCCNSVFDTLSISPASGAVAVSGQQQSLPGDTAVGDDPRTECIDPKTGAVVAAGHDFKDGTCTVCGIADRGTTSADASPSADDTRPVADNSRPATVGIAVWGTLLAVIALCGIVVAAKKHRS